MDPASTPWPLPERQIPELTCSPPTGLTAVVNGDSVSFRWIVPHDNDGLYLEFWVDGGDHESRTFFGSNATFKLQPMTTYNWSLRLMCSREDDRGSTVIIGVPFTTGEALPTNCVIIDSNASVVIVSGNTVRIQWPAIAGIKVYNVMVGPSNSSLERQVYTTGSNYITFDTVYTNRLYDWWVKPVCDVSTWSARQTFDSGPGSFYTPITLYSKAGINDAIIFWKNDTELVGVDVYLDEELIENMRHPANVIRLSNLDSDTTYRLSIVPYYNGGKGDIRYIDVTTNKDPINVPTGLTMTDNADAIIISWIVPDGIDSQILTINGSVIYYDASVSFHVIAKAVPDTVYAVTVQSVLGDRKSAASSAVLKTKSYLPFPDNLSVLFVWATSVMVGWNSVPGAARYSLRVRRAHGVWSSRFFTDKTSYTISGLTEELDHEVELRTVNETGSLSDPLIVTFTTLALPAGVVPYQLNIIDITDTSFKLEYLTNYLDKGKLMRLDITDPSLVVTSMLATASPIIVTGLTPDTDYGIKLYNISNPGNESSNDPLNLHTLKTCVAPVNIVAAFIGDDLNITWDVVLDNDHYSLFIRKVGVSDWTEIPVVVPGNVTVNSPGKAVYEVTVTNQYSLLDPGYNQGGACSTTVNSATPQVTGVAVDMNGNLMRATWDPIDGVDYYRVLITSLTETEDRIAFGNSINLELNEMTNYSIEVGGVFGSAAVLMSNPVVFKSGCIPPVEPEPCSKPIFDAIIQDTHINTPATPIDTLVDLVVNIKNYDPFLRYSINVMNSIGEVPIRALVIPVQNELDTGTIVIDHLPADTYKVEVNTYIGLTKYCSDTKQAIVFNNASPSELVVSDETESSAHIEWTAPEGREVLGYEVWVSDKLVGYVSCTSYDLTTLEDTTTYSIKVRARYDEYSISGFLEGEVTTTGPVI